MTMNRSNPPRPTLSIFARWSFPFLLGALCLTATNVSAHLPKSIKASGTVLALDFDSRTLLFKQAKGKKPLLLEWDQATEFRSNSVPTTARDLRSGTSVVIYYRHVTFHNPLLKTVTWTVPADAK